MTQRLLISSGTGPEEVRRFVALLAERLLKECRARRIDIVREEVAGPPKAPRSVALVVADAGGFLRQEVGSHALVARSAGRGKRSRKRWFARVALLDEPEPIGTLLAPKDVEFHACRSGGPGGQNVNKRSTAVRLLHCPSGLSVRVNAERSQWDNRRLAERRLQEALEGRLADSNERSAAQLRLCHYRLERGGEVRTYHIDNSGRLLAIEDTTDVGSPKKEER
jgi:peptide chain release factor 2/peptide chain release factor